MTAQELQRDLRDFGPVEHRATDGKTIARVVLYARRDEPFALMVFPATQGAPAAFCEVSFAACAHAITNDRPIGI